MSLDTDCAELPDATDRSSGSDAAYAHAGGKGEEEGRSGYDGNSVAADERGHGPGLTRTAPCGETAPTRRARTNFFGNGALGTFSSGNPTVTRPAVPKNFPAHWARGGRCLWSGPRPSAAVSAFVRGPAVPLFQEFQQFQQFQQFQ
jgi:hypothetical protein